MNAPTFGATWNAFCTSVATAMFAPDGLVQVIGDPNVAYLLFVFGLVALIAELYQPGGMVLGTLGVVALVLALVGFSQLPVTWAGVLLVVLAMGLFVAELHTGLGALAAAGFVVLVAGSVVLYGSPFGVSSTEGAVRVSAWVIGLMSAAVATFFMIVVRALLRAQRLAVRTGIAALVGRPGVATSDLDPQGTVRVDSETWSARSSGRAIRAGERVEVVGASGVTLQVAPPRRGDNVDRASRGESS